MPSKFDHAADNASRSFEPLTYTFGETLKAHTILPIYVAADQGGGGKTTNLKEYYSNNSVWEDNIRAGDHFHGDTVKLNNFFLFEWFPRSPGLYFTDTGRQARDDAQSRIIGTKDGTIVYSPYGKQSMLDGGVGNVRLQPLHIRDQEWMFISASDNGVCHQGFPVAMPIDLYRKCIDEIKGRGVAIRTLIGELKFVPKELEEAYASYTEVRKFYLEIHEIQPPTEKKSRTYAGLDVSVAVSFDGIVDGKSDIYAAYVTFDPGNRNNFKEAVQWMGNEYIASYNGKVLTDFDEHENHFPGARFSLQKVMKLGVSESDFRSVHADIYVENLIAFQELMKSKYKISGGNIGAVGDNARVSDARQYMTSNPDEAPRVTRAVWRRWPFRRG